MPGTAVYRPRFHRKPRRRVLRVMGVAGSALVPGSLSTATIAVSIPSAAPASGGSSPYTYQWYGSTSSGFTPGGGNLLAGQTAADLTAYAVTAGSNYYFVRRATDNVGATADTSQFTFSGVSGSGGSSTYSRGRVVNNA